jgi:hypothetical protein
MIIKLQKITLTIVLIGFSLFSINAQAASSSFFVDWSGASHLNTAQASGVLTVNDALFSNSTGDLLLLPGTEVLGFSLTVSGADSGNGSFQLSDFEAFSWSTSSVPLDLSHELVGQVSFAGAGWGGLHDGSAGDFNLLSFNGVAPSAASAFTLSTSNGLNMNLVSFRPVPIPGALWMFGAGLAGFVVARKGRKQVIS